MNKQPTFSVIMPVFNREKHVERAINSVLNQTLSDWELIIIDDCSTDGSWNIISAVTDPRVRALRNERNEERCVSRNKGIAAAHGKYIAFLDSDDTFLENHLHTVYDFLNGLDNPSVMVFTNSYVKIENGERYKKIVPQLDTRHLFGYLLKYTPNPARVCVSSDILQSFTFDPSIPGLEDLDLWLRIATKHPVMHIEQYTNEYHHHGEMYSQADSKRYEKELRFFKQIFEKNELKKLLPRSSCYRLLSMCHYHISAEHFKKGVTVEFWPHAFASFFLYPRGYNGKTLKPLLVMMLYSIPILGVIFRAIRNYVR